VLDDPLPWLQDVVRARKPRRLPVVLTKDEVRSILAEMSGTPKLVVSLLYGTGMRLLEGLRLRVKDDDQPGSGRPLTLGFRRSRIASATS
jgi:integrase